MNDPEVVHQWLETRREGRISELRADLTWFFSSSHTVVNRWEIDQWLRLMAALGHIEVIWQQGLWRLPPPVLFRFSSEEALLGVAGVSSARLEMVLGELDISLVSAPQPLHPRIPALPSANYVVSKSSKTIRNAMKALNAHYEGNVSDRMSRKLKVVGLGELSAPPIVREGRDALRYEPESRSWKPIQSISGGPGLFRVRQNNKLQHLYLYRESWYRVDLAAGVQIERARLSDKFLRWRQDPVYKSAIGILFVDSDVPLTTSQERVLVSSSGLIGRSHEAAETVRFENVSLDVARRVAVSARSQIEIQKGAAG